VQKPYPPFVIGGSGEQLTLRVVARYADIWNGLSTSPEDFARKSAILNEHCAAIGRDPAAIERSVQIIINPNDLAAGRDALRGFIQVGATHLVLYLRSPFAPGIARRMADEIARPLRDEFA